MTKATTIDEVIERLNSLSDVEVMGPFESEEKEWAAELRAASVPEDCHWEADALVLDALTLLGRADVAKAYLAARSRVHFWYS